MEYIEFNKFLCETNIFGTENHHSNVLLKIFVGSAKCDKMNDESTSLVQSGANIATEIHQHEFFICLIRIAIYKYSTLNKQRFTTMRKKGHDVSITKVNQVKSLLISEPSRFKLNFIIFYQGIIIVMFYSITAFVR